MMPPGDSVPVSYGWAVSRAFEIRRVASERASELVGVGQVDVVVIVWRGLRRAREGHQRHCAFYASPEERATWLNRLKESAPNNPLGNYLYALDAFKAGHNEQALQEQSVKNKQKKPGGQ